MVFDKVMDYIDEEKTHFVFQFLEKIKLIGKFFILEYFSLFGCVQKANTNLSFIYDISC